ncbi:MULTISPECIES: stalk domain-containing protein [unclassified Paenibacillus]|uniref:stalk domain-containing protein n=1 Tax=unclassified Paenibacillus TaxID=185978 RepID=UPI00363E94D8
MNKLLKGLTVFSVVASCVLGGYGNYAKAAESNMVEMVIPPLPTNLKQTDEQDAFNKKNGRPLPTPEFMQPLIDSSLPSYKPRKDIELSGSFKGASSDVLPSLVSLWIEEFKKYYPKVNIEIVPPYAGSLGARELLKETVEFVFVSRELKPEDVVDFKAQYGYEPLSVPISGASYRHFGFLDSMGFYVHKDNPLEKLNFDQLDALYSATHHRGGGAITTWGELGLTGEWADKPINLYGIQPWNGFEEFIRQKVLSTDGQRGEWREGITFDKLVFPAAGRVADDRYGLGYSGLAYIDKGVKLIALAENSTSPYYSPTYENVASAKYPLSRLIYFNANKQPGKELNPVLDEFMKFILSKEGQQQVLKHAIYLPLRAEQASDSLAMVTGVPEVKVAINNAAQSFVQAPVIRDGNVLVPLGDIFGKLGAAVVWDGDKRSVTASKGNTKLKLTIGSTTAVLNGAEKTLEVPVQVVRNPSNYNSTMVPLRFVSEAFGANVTFDKATRTVTVNTK